MAPKLEIAKTMMNPRDLRQRQVGSLSVSLLLHGCMAIAIAVAPSALLERPQELATAVYLEDTGATMPKGEQAQALPVAGPTQDTQAQAAPAPQAGDATPLATQTDPSDVVIAPLPAKAASPAPAKKAKAPPKALPAKTTPPEPAPAPEIATEEESDVNVASAMTAETPAEETPEPEADDTQILEEEKARAEAEAEAQRAREEQVLAEQKQREDDERKEREKNEALAAAVAARPAATPVPAVAKAQPGAGQVGAPGGEGASQNYGIREASDLKSAPGNRPPDYPERDRLMRKQGTVVFLARVKPDGTIADIRLEKSTQSKTLDMAALEAMKKWRFLPGQEGMVRKGFTFSLDGEAQELPARLRR